MATSELSEGAWEGARMCGQGYRFESMDIRDYQGKRAVVDNSPFTKMEFQRRRLRALDVGAHFFDIGKVGPSPQHGVGYEYFPPVSAYVGQRR